MKDSWEIGEIRSAIRLAEKAFAMFRAMIRPGDTEKDLSDAMEMYRAASREAKARRFPTIVAGGDRAALPHAPLTERAVGGEMRDPGRLGRQRAVLQKRLDTRSHSP